MVLRMIHFDRSGYVKHSCKFKDSVEAQELRQTQWDVVIYLRGRDFRDLSGDIGIAITRP